MASTKFELDADIREDLGKGASRRLRHANKVPAIIYGANEPAVSLTLNHDKVITALKNEAFYSHILTLKLGSKQEKVVLKAIQRNPAKPRILHMDFMRIRADQKLTMRIPLHFLGEDDAPGVKEGGMISHNMTDLEVSCLPANLPEYIEIDVSQLTMDQTIHLTDIKLPKGVDLVAFAHGIEDHDLPVVSIHKPRMAEEETVEMAAEETPEAGAAEADTSAENADKKE